MSCQFVCSVSQKQLQPVASLLSRFFKLYTGILSLQFPLSYSFRSVFHLVPLFLVSLCLLNILSCCFISLVCSNVSQNSLFNPSNNLYHFYHGVFINLVFNCICLFIKKKVLLNCQSPQEKLKAF